MLIMSLRKRISQFAADRRGVSAVEFAFLAPVMITLYLGCVEISSAIAVDRKVSLAAAALANLSSSSQVATISASEMQNIFDASTAILSPYSNTPLKMTLACIAVDGSKKATVKWTVTRNGAALTTGALSVPTDLLIANTQLVFSQVSYTYTPTIGTGIIGPLTLSDKMYMVPRQTAPTYVAAACT